MLQYRALGGLGVVDGDGELNLGGPRQRRLAAALLIDRNRVVSVDRLGEVVFAGEPTARAATTLRSYVARLRRVVENGASGTQVVTRAPGYMLVVDDEAFDAARFESAVATGRAGLAGGDLSGASRALRAGLAMWRGAAYAEFAEEEWARPEAQRLDELRLVAYDLLADADLARGRSAEVAAELEALVAEHPLRDSPDDDRNGSSTLNAEGDRLAVYTSYGTVVWDLRPDRMVEAACAVAGRNLTQAEWDQYVGSLGPYRRLCPDAA